MNLFAAAVFVLYSAASGARIKLALRQTRVGRWRSRRILPLALWRDPRDAVCTRVARFLLSFASHLA